MKTMSLQQIRDKIVDNYNSTTRLTMLTPELLDNIEYCIRDVVNNKIEGDFIESGVWRGGACIYAYHVLKELDEARKVYVADSFEGLPKPKGLDLVDGYSSHFYERQYACSEKDFFDAMVLTKFCEFGIATESICMLAAATTSDFVSVSESSKSPLNNGL